jgi:hypothetical protein
MGLRGRTYRSGSMWLVRRGGAKALGGMFEIGNRISQFLK